MRSPLAASKLAERVEDGAVLMGESDRHAKRVRQLIRAHLPENDTLGVEMGIGVLRGAA